MNSLSISQTCKNCGSEQIENYCCNCGQKVIEKRFSVKFFFIAILDTFNLERGLFYTYKMLLTKPGVVINDYISGKTKPYYNPLKYIILAAAISAFLVLWLNIFEEGMKATNNLMYGDSIQANEQALQLQQKVIVYLKKFMNLITLLLIPFVSLGSKWFFRAKKLFFGEHLIMNSFLFGQSTFIILLFMPLVIIFPQLTASFELISSTVTIIYLSYSYCKIFSLSKFKAIISALFVYFIGLLLSMLFFSIVGLIVAIVSLMLGNQLV